MKVTMRCLRCGYCCIAYDVIIVNDPKLGIIESNLIHKVGGLPCPHLKKNEDNTYTCLIHEYEWYSETPCHSHVQSEKQDSDCRVGKFKIKIRSDR